MVTDHWTTSESRGLYGTQESSPPQPQHHSANDFGARMARIEEHLQFAAHNMRRIESESMHRASDIVGWANSRIGSLGRDLTDCHQRLSLLERSEMKRVDRWQGMADLLSGTRNGLTLLTGLLKWLSVATIGYLLVSGKITVDAAKLLLSAFGWQSGS